jgi:hypothetical protein
MRAPNRTKTINRREFLKGAATLSTLALVQRLWGDVVPPAQATDAKVTPTPLAAFPGAIIGDLDDHVYLPLVAKKVGPAHGPSKLGLHTLNPDGAVGFVQAVHDAGAYVALVKALDNFGYLRQVKEISPETVTVARCGPAKAPQAVDPSGDPVQKATDMMNQHMPYWEYERDVVDYWELLNENAPPTIAQHVWLAEFFIAAMDIAEVNGHKLAIFSYSTGVPQWHHWEAIVETGVFARAKAGEHALALHEYDWPVADQRWGEPTEDLPPYEDRGVLSGRYRYLYRDFLIQRDEVIPLVITEAGLDPVVGGPDLPQPWQERYVEEMIWYDTLMREDDYVVGAAMFSIGTFANWVRYDYEELLWPGNPYGPNNFFDYIVSLKDA